VTLIGTGVKSVLALEAAGALEKEGVDARVLHIHTVKLLDREAVIRAAEETCGLVTMENHSVIGGLGGAVAEVLTDARPAPLKRIGIPDVFGESGDDDLIFAKMGLSVEGAVRTVKQLLD
jgi:transketolase